MRNGFIAIFFVLLYGCHSAAPPSSTSVGQSEIYAIEICYVEENIDTPIAVTCDNFESAFGDEIEKIVITDSCLISQIMIALKEAPIADYNWRHLIDSRYKLNVYRGDSIETICADRFAFVYNGEIYKKTDKFKELLDSIIA